MGARSELVGGFGDEVSWSLLDAAPDGMLLVTESGEVAFANEQAATLFRSSTKGMLGRSIDEFLPADLRGPHRAHRTRYRARPEVRAMGAGLDLRAVRVDGSEFHAEISLSPLRLGAEVFVLAAVRDISERVAAEDKLRRVLHTLDASDDAIFIFDADTLRYSHVNEGAVRLVGYSRDELTTMGPMHLNPYSTEAEYRELVAELLANPTAMVRRATRVLRKDGTEVPIETIIQAAPPDRDGSRWVVALARDLTARLQAEEVLRQNQEALREAEQVVVLAEDRGRIARDLHDTVIQRLFGVGLGLQSTLATADERTRARLETSIEEVDATIRELRSAVFSLQGSPVPPVGLRSQLLEVVSQAGKVSGVEARLEFDGPIDALDQRTGEDLIVSLREALSNAPCHAQDVRVAVTATDDSVTLTVTDNGVEIGGGGLSGRELSLDAVHGPTLAPNEQ